jgi:regulator of protease activity HflC (stomatin/prohibitin superfamily)
VLKKISLFALLGVVLTGCTRVEPGNVGIKVNLYGSNKGVDDITLATGRVWYNPITEDIYTFPTYMQNGVWTRDEIDDSPEDESITFNSVEGAVINADIAVSYQIIPESVPSIFVELRQDSNYIKNVYVRSKTRDSFSRHASKMKVVDIFGAKKEELLSAVKEDLQTNMPGFKFDMITFIGGLRVDPLVEQSISSTIQATQRAIEAENKVKQSTAEAQQKVEEARGLAESILLESKARAEANEMLTKSLSPALLQYEALQKWDGILPKVTGEVVPFISVDEKN